MAEEVMAGEQRAYLISLAVAVIYFFFNSLLLPEGLLYTAILTPFFLWWTLKSRLVMPYILFFAITLAYAIIHYKLGVQPLYYLRSWFLAFCAVTFAVTVYNYLKKGNDAGIIFEKIARYNLLLIPIALLSLVVHPFNEYFWYYKPISPGIKAFPRLSMLTYEASYYSFLFIPIYLYLLLKVLFNRAQNVWLYLAMVIIPLALSLSFGVISTLAITLACILILQFKQIIDTPSKRRLLAGIIASVFIAAILILFVFPDNPIAQRVSNLFSYKDTSFRGRTNEAFDLAIEIASAKSLLFGVGFGQIKVVGHDIYFHFYKFTYPVIRIPNTLAETLAMFGVIGLALRMVAEIWLFFKTRVHTNIYRTAIFIFVFLYQLQGSFLFNTIELVLWVIAFTPSFAEFDRDNINSKSAR